MPQKWTRLHTSKVAVYLKSGHRGAGFSSRCCVSRAKATPSMLCKAPQTPNPKPLSSEERTLGQIHDLVHFKGLVATPGQLVTEDSDTATERRGNNLKDFKDFYLKAKSRIWP